jgi:CBS domain-containing protein
MDDEPRVRNIMSTSVIAVPPAMDIAEVARLLVEHDISGAPVIDGQRVIGVITEMDIVSRHVDVAAPAYGTFLDAIFRLPWDRSDDELRRVLARTAGDLMTSPAVTISADAPVHEAANLMFKRKVNPLPVVDASGAMIGIVSRSDIVRLIAEA